MKRKIIAGLFATFFIALTVIPCFAVPPRLDDSAFLLEDNEQAEVLALLDEISERQSFDIVIVTTNSLGGKSAMEYADDYFDYNGFGFGERHDGCILLVDMGSRNYWISTSGYGITAITDNGIDYLGSIFKSYLSSGNYISAFESFAQTCDSLVTQAKNGTPYDKEVPKSKEEANWKKIILYSLFFGASLGFVPVLIMKSKLNSVHMNSGASDYMKENSLNIESRSDIYLYSTVSKVKKETEKSGSSTHTSSSGNSHGGGGGSF